MTEPKPASPAGHHQEIFHSNLTSGATVGESKEPGRGGGFFGRRSVAFWTVVAGIVSVVILVLTIPGFIAAGGFTAGTDRAAVKIQACETTHHLTAVTVQQQPTADTTIFATCGWPPTPGADPDGYTAVTNTLVSLPDGSNASSDTQVRRITGPCARFELAFTWGHMGDMKRLPVLTASPDSVIKIDYDTPTPYEL